MSRNKVSGQDLVGFHARGLAQRKWQFFGTLAFRRRSVPVWMAVRCFNAWLSEIEGRDGDFDGFRWFCVNERGAFPDKPMFHVLVGGLRSRSSKYELMASWQQIAGDADIEYFCRHGNVLTFISDIARRGAEFEIDYDLS
ncbi:MAG: hypothetical protein WA734_11740 [Candidatus Acidiferrales bacterium]